MEEDGVFGEELRFQMKQKLDSILATWRKFNKIKMKLNL